MFMHAPKEEYGKADVIVAGPDANMRNAIKMSLQGQGFRDFRVGSNIENVRAHLKKAAPDLIIANDAMADGDTCALIRMMRHNQCGENPFVPVIIYSQRLDNNVLGRVMRAGADTLIGYPITPATLASRIRFLVKKRKPFVVTFDYVGPDRRQDSREVSKLPLLDVPNTLKIKAEGKEPDMALIKRQIEDAIRWVEDCKTERCADRIVTLSQQVVDSFEKGEFHGKGMTLLRDLRAATESVQPRLESRDFPQACQLAVMMLQLISLIEANPGRVRSKDIALLCPIAQAIILSMQTQDVNAASISMSKLLSMLQDIPLQQNHK